MRILKQLLLAALVAPLIVHSSSAAVIITIQPSADLADIVWSVSWDSLAGNGTTPLSTFDWNAMDPATGGTEAVAPWGATVRQVFWSNVGNPFGPLYMDGAMRGFGDGAGGVVSTPGGWGVGPDDDGVGVGDDLFIFNTLLNTTDPFPASGAFLLTIPGAHLANYNIGVHNSNPNVTITVTDTPFQSDIPEPGTMLLVGTALLGLMRLRKSPA